ncbi:hypothetical protein G4B88_018367 [Cannabis sativa]|uniref:Endonuclease/exonuclease/phosphatase domain-containing protein n=1 Tax=Cannabis sativa TaxID=3483 RepID=A0A7J6DZZ8_CANSA|nr:hypothetical protein G4B88_018367 [Cannabis sativa]
MKKERKRKMKGRISRIGSYAISSAIRDQQHLQQPCITCTTFNILAPIYKRLNHEDPSCRESDYRAFWMTRNQSILDWLLYERSSIIWLLTAVHKDFFRVLNSRELHFNDCGDRVAQLLHVELASPISQCRNNDPITNQEILIVNTHLLFPHDSSLCLVRLHQVYKILQCVESYQKENNLNSMPIILCGDWNGSKRGHVYKFLRSLGFVSSYDTAHQYDDADAHKWVSHRNHRGNICGVDFIWLLNPNSYRKFLRTSWTEAVFGMFKLNLIGHCYGLSDEETKDLWDLVDIDGNGQRIWNPAASEQRDEYIEEVVEKDGVKDTQSQLYMGNELKSPSKAIAAVATIKFANTGRDMRRHLGTLLCSNSN